MFVNFNHHVEFFKGTEDVRATLRTSACNFLIKHPIDIGVFTQEINHIAFLRFMEP